MTEQRRPGGLPEMPCQEFVEAVTAYLEGALDAADHARLETHLAACAACAIYLEQLRITLREVGRIAPETLSQRTGGELRDAFRAWARSP
jgi:anti-sigma factor RsiW